MEEEQRKALPMSIFRLRRAVASCESYLLTRQNERRKSTSRYGNRQLRLLGEKPRKYVSTMTETQLQNSNES